MSRTNLSSTRRLSLYVPAGSVLPPTTKAKGIVTKRLIRAALVLRLPKSEPLLFVSTIILKMRTDNEIGLGLQSFRNSAKRAGAIDTNTVRGHGATALDLHGRSGH